MADRAEVQVRVNGVDGTSAELNAGVEMPLELRCKRTSAELNAELNAGVEPQLTRWWFQAPVGTGNIQHRLFGLI